MTISLRNATAFSLVIVVTLCLLLVVFLVFRISETTYELIEVGMTKDLVESILGKPDHIQHATRNMSSLSDDPKDQDKTIPVQREYWFGRDIYFVIEFDEDNRVVFKSCFPTYGEKLPR